MAPSKRIRGLNNGDKGKKSLENGVVVEKMEPASRKTFNLLAIELNQMIAASIERDSDLAAFRAICRATNEAVDCKQHSFWRMRFLAYFDPLPSGSREHLVFKEQYQHRRKVLRSSPIIRDGSTKIEQRTIRVLRDLIVESLNGDVATGNSNQILSRNTEIVRRFAIENGLLYRMCEPNENEVAPLLATVQLSLVHLSLNSAFNYVFGYPQSQLLAYAAAKDEPIFTGFNQGIVNMRWVLHLANFFRYHMLNSDEHSSLFEALNGLSNEQKPRGWAQQPGREPAKLERHWKGTYAFLTHEEVLRIRDSSYETGEQIFMDGHVDNAEPVQDIRLEFPDHGLDWWPAYFERHLHSKPRKTVAKTRAQHRVGGVSSETVASVPFKGFGVDESEPFLSVGHLNPLPAQHGIPGWRRMTMMKYYLDRFGNVDFNSLWAYEGVVLPGGRIIIGRWWSPNDEGDPGEAYSGPFILWASEPQTPQNLDGM